MRKTTQRTIFSYLPHYELVDHIHIKEYENLINAVHEQVVKSTGEPKEQRAGTSLTYGASTILNIVVGTTNPFYQAAFIYHHLAEIGHYFYEGNKRTAHYMAKLHLFKSGYHFKVGYRYAVPFIEKIAAGEKKIPETIDWLEKYSKRYYKRAMSKHLNKIVKEITVYEKRGRPLKDGGKRYR